ncbi:MAG: 16S rRNA (guanine(966)-N(2))-methyltransferase RsmD [Elusimicrobia bacterium]|nr:16S rRNA (guanine(966)-N(2))-methyltransferase RsmD [Elusimicrobiota bacterium]
MRIIGGEFRGRKIKARQNPAVRPISGRIKKSLFDILKLYIPQARVLDLFAGTGAVGIEALSRGASFAFFVDLNPHLLKELEANLERTGMRQRARTHPGSALEDLSWIPFRSGVSQFDLIFLGPPYKDLQKEPLTYSTPALRRVHEAGLLAPGGLIVCQHHVKEPIEAPPGLELFRREKYGDTFLSFLRAAKA